MENTELKFTVSNRQVHKALHNILFNEMNISEQFVHDHIKKITEQKIENILREHLFDSKWFRTVVEQTIFRLMNDGVKTTLYHNHKPFTDFVTDQVKLAIKNVIIDNLDFNIKMKSSLDVVDNILKNTTNEENDNVNNI